MSRTACAEPSRGPASFFGTRPVCRAILYCLLCSLLITSTASARADEPPALHIGAPVEHLGILDFELDVSHLFAGDAIEALHSGLPATVVIRWSLWRQRSGWWDDEVVSGSTFFRVYYDVLEERYDLFDRSGRPLAGSRDLAEIEDALCRRRGLSTVRADRLKRDATYVLEVLARLEPLDEQQIGELESWARGESGKSKPFLSTVTRRAVGWLKNRVGPEARSAWAKSKPFRLSEMGR